MTQGKAFGILLRFSLPMLLSVVFQQFYNIADTMIAGKFIGEDALSAVGASYPVTMLFMAFATGSNIGCSVVVSRLFGAKRLADMKTAINTALISSVALSVILTVVGILTSEPLLKLLDTPTENNVLKDAAVYLNIYIGGMLFLFLYNIANGIFTAIGDSRTPLYFLIASSIANIALDCVFVICFDLGVAGVAWATFITQSVACTLSVVTLVVRLRQIEHKGKAELFSPMYLKSICRIAVPSIVQQASISVGNLFVQRFINGFGSAAVAGYSAANKINTFTVTSLTTLGNALSSFTGQNLGAGRRERVREGLRAMLKIAFAFCIPITLLFLVANGELIGLFMKEQSYAAMSAGRLFLQVVAPFYAVIALKLTCDGVLRGSGAMKEFMVSTMTDLVIRVVLSFVLSKALGSVVGIWLSWPIGWAVGAVLSFVFYKSTREKSIAFFEAK